MDVEEVDVEVVVVVAVPAVVNERMLKRKWTNNNLLLMFGKTVVEVHII